MVVEAQATVETGDEIDAQAWQNILGQWWVILTVGGLEVKVELGKAEDIHQALGNAIAEAKKNAAAATAAR